MKTYLTALILFALAPFLVLAPAFAQDGAAETPELLTFGPPQPLIVETEAGPLSFSVEVADTDEHRAQGMMFRQTIGEDEGMLFDFVEPRPVTIWMKNTLIPLDIIFINTEGRIISIARNARPKSLRTIPSGGVAKAVLEIAGGGARKNGIAQGNLIRHAMFGNLPTANEGAANAPADDAGDQENAAQDEEAPANPEE